MKVILILILFIYSTEVYANLENRIKKYLHNNGVYEISFDRVQIISKGFNTNDQYLAKWDLEGVIRPTENTLPSEEESKNVDNEYKEYVQNKKSKNLKIVENKFLLFCDELNESTNKTKLTFTEITEKISSITNELYALKLFANFTVLDLEGKREGGQFWWNDVEWHNDITDVAIKGIFKK